MKHVVTFNVLSPAGLPTPARVSVDVKDVGRDAAVVAARLYMGEIGVRIVEQPCSVRSSGFAGRRAARGPKLSL